ncbi:hypothetical protein AGMMS50267_06410 [Spirochaetia bacterium]|nr:hypothetical protein AGMMS50267_06410 [Spirochaetia bacterium]
MGMVSYTHETMPPVNREALAALAAMKDEDIDCSDIPPLDTLALRLKSSPLSRGVDRGMYRPVKVAVTCKLDADVVAWLKRGGKGYQTRLNSILRQAMAHAQ